MVTQLPASDGPPPLWTAGFVLICIANLAFWMCVFFQVLLLPLYMQELGFQEATIGLAYGVAALTALLARVLSGWAIDRWGGRYFLLTGALIWGITASLMPLVTAGVFLIIIRLIQGAGLALFMNASLGYVATTTPAQRRGAAMSWWGMANNLATAIAPALAVVVLQRWGFTPTFLVAGMIAMIVIVIALVLPGTPAPSDPTKARSVTFYTPSAILPGCIGATLGFAGGAFIIFAPLRAQELQLDNVGLYLTCYALAMIVARFVAGPISDTKGREWAILPGLLFMVVAMVLIGFISDPLLGLIVPTLFGLGLGSAMPGLLAWTMDRADPTNRTVAGSTFYSLYEIGLFLGAPMIGFLLQRSSFVSFVVVAVVLTIACGVYFTTIRVQTRMLDQQLSSEMSES